MNLIDTQRLEGSRSVSWQLYRLAAGGSRERLLALQLYRLRYDPENGKTALELAIRWVLNHPFGVRKLFEDEND